MNIYTFLLERYPLFELCDDKYDNKYILNNIKDSKYAINFNSQKIILKNEEIINNIAYLLKTTNKICNKLKQVIHILIMYKILFDNSYFLITNNKFKTVTYNKIVELKRDANNSFNHLSPVNNNINPLETILKLFSLYLNNIYSIEFIFEKHETIYEMDYLCNNNLILSLHPFSNIIHDDIILNFKVINNLDIVTFNKIHYSISRLPLNEVCILALYENFINNINYLQNNNELKENAKKNLRELINYNLSNFNKYKKYSYNINPLIILNNLFKFFLD